MRHRRFGHVLAALALISQLGACAMAPDRGTAPPIGVPRSDSPPATSGTAAFSELGLVFEYPANWRAFHYSEGSSFSSLIAILSTVDVAHPCVTQTFANGGGQVSCQDRYTLVPDSLVVAQAAVQHGMRLGPGAAFHPDNRQSPFMRFNVAIGGDARLYRFLAQQGVRRASAKAEAMALA